MDILNEKIEGLVKKAEKSGMPYSILKKVYDRGMAAWKTGHRPGTTPQQWAFARVNSFVTKSSGTWGKADKDLAKQVRGEEVEKRKNAKEMIGQVREKLGKDADAGDYVKDFRKSKAPQFKGKSDKKIQKMAIAAYLDSKEEVKEETELKELSLADKNQKKIAIDTLISPRLGLLGGPDEKEAERILRTKFKFTDKMIKKLKEETCPKCNEEPCKCKSLQESGHTDVASMKTQVQIAMDALQKMNTELGKLSDEEDLPTWWTNKVATAVGKLDGMADYIDAKHDQGEKMNEDNITEEKVFVVRFEKEGMRFAVPFSDMKRAKDGEKILKKSAGVSNVSVTQDILKPGVSMSKFRTRQEGRILPESKMGAFFLDMQIDANEMSERDFIKKYQGEMGMTARELKDLYREMTEEVIKEENLQEGMDAKTAKAILKMRAKDKFEIFRGDYVPMIYLSNLDRKALKDAGHKMTRDIPKPTMGTTVTGILNVANGSSKSVDRAGMYDTETDDMKGKNPAVINMKKYDMKKDDFEKVGYPKTVGDLVKMTKLRLNSNDPMSNEEVDNSLMAQATRVISQTSIKEKIDPADIDVKATAADRKAADKNIIIQLRRAQDMEKQTGRADQSGIEFLDKKKQKVDPKIINKALDMFDKMKPNDKAKMQKTIGKSYRDLLKTVQRGRI